MTELQQSMHRVLNGLVETPTEHGDWSRVLADARRSGRRTSVLRVAVVAVAAVVAVGLALVSPFEEEQPTGVIDRALAAIGDGPVIHLVTRGDWGADLVDLETGEVRPLHAESEVWYDPKRGAHFVYRLGDQVTTDGLVPPERLTQQQAGEFVALANRYRDELQSGEAKVIGRGRVGERDVIWIRVRSMWAARGDGKEHLYAEEVAVDPATYEPVYMRTTDDGKPVPGGSQLIVELETLAAGRGDFNGEDLTRQTVRFGGAAMREHLTVEELTRALDGKALWLGRSHAGKPLVESRVQEFRSKANREAEWDVSEGISLFYGSLAPRRGGIRIRDHEKPFVEILQGTRAAVAWRGARMAADLPEGSLLLLAGGRTGFLRRDGVLVSVNGGTVRDVLVAAFALRRVGGPPPRQRVDVERIAGLVRARELPRAEGGAPVRPRPLIPPNAKRLQTGVAKGVKVTTYAGGGASFDTRGMDRALQRFLPNTIMGRCFGLHGDTAGSGAAGAIPKSGVRQVALQGQPGQLRRARPVISRFDACELGAGFGRNWLPRFDWHWPVEIPLTERGRKFFEERAAALELAHFVRNGPRRRAREAMRRGEPSPRAAALRDPARPEIRVSTRSDGFRATLTASTGRRFFVEIVRGRVGRTNAKSLAFIR